MDVQKFFNKGRVIWYAVFSKKLLDRITDENVKGSIPFQTQTYEMAEDRPNVFAEIKEIFNIGDSCKKQGHIELSFLKIMLSPRVLQSDNFRKEFKIKVEEALVRWTDSKIVKDAQKMLNLPDPVIKGVLGSI